MKRHTNQSLEEKAAEAYWNAFRAGYIGVGGDKSYPLWSESSDQIKAETVRCMRHALEVLRAVEGFAVPMAKALPGKPQRRRDVPLTDTDAKFGRIINP